MRTKIRWMAWLMVLGLFVAACGGDATSDTTAAPDDTAETTAAPDDSAETTAVPDPGTETTEAAPNGDITTDFGVDLEAQVIRIGMLSDLTGRFGALVSAILAGSEAYWTQVNAAGGVNGLQVELVVRDTTYDVTNHIALYGEIKDQVVAIGHSTGSPHTVAINADLQADGMFAIPLTWYSGWSDSAINANLLSHGVSYCLEAMNTIGYLKEVDNIEAATIAIASLPGDYGLDSAAGAQLAAEALGLTVVDVGIGGIVDESALTAVADAIVESNADIVWVATDPISFGSIYGQAFNKGVETRWSGPSPSWSPALVAPDSAIKDAIARDFIGGLPTTIWTADAMAPWRDAFLAAGAPPTDYYAEGIVEAIIVHQALLQAYDNGDMTRAGVLAAAKSLDNVDFGGIAPAESYVGADNDRLQRSGFIFQPDPAGLADGSSAGSILLESEYTSQIAAAYEFAGACYVLE